MLLPQISVKTILHRFYILYNFCWYVSLDYWIRSNKCKSVIKVGFYHIIKSANLHSIVVRFFQYFVTALSPINSKYGT